MPDTTDQERDEPVEGRKRPLRIVAAAALTVAAVAGIWQLRGAATQAGTTERIATCEALQPDSDNQEESVVVCLTQTLVDAAEAGTYTEILALTENLRKGRLQASCHAAGHRAGLELYAEYGMAEALTKIFPAELSGGDAPVDYICTSAVVHGLVGGGEVDGSDPMDVARNCVSLDRVEPRYTHECAHFYGHGVWRRIGSLGGEIAAQCDLLAGGVTGLAPEICVTGAVMQKYDLQTKHYDPFNEEAKKRETPSREELETLCATVTGSTSFTNGCRGAVGWLAAMRAQDTLDEFDENSSAYRELAIEAYSTELGVCRETSGLQEQCVQNFITHFRPQAYHDGIAREVCEIVGVDRNRCERVIALRTGSAVPVDEPVATTPAS